MKNQSLIILLLLISTYTIAQRPGHNPTTPAMAFNAFQEQYDQGFIVSGFSPGWYNLNYGLIAKTDINGKILWKKFVGESSALTEFIKARPTLDGGFVVAGKSYIYDSTEYPLFVKFNACGNVEWSKIIAFAGFGGYYDIVQFTDGSYVALFNQGVDFSNGNGFTILMNLDSYGNPTIIDTLNSNTYSGTSIVGLELLEMPDSHLFIPAGPINSGGSPITLKTDKHGTLDWSIWCNSAESGIFRTALANDGSLYSSGDLLFAPNGGHALVFKFRDGELIWTKPMLGDSMCYGRGPICVYSDNIYIGTFDAYMHYLAVYDSSGNLLSKQTDMIGVQELIKTSDNKIMALRPVAVGQTPGDILVRYRMSPQLDSIIRDSLYITPRMYDSQCQQAIVTDTTLLSPDIITGIPPSLPGNSQATSLVIYPNPAQGRLHVWLPQAPTEQARLQIYNSDGMEVFRKAVPEGLRHLDIDISLLSPGLYLLQYSSGNCMAGSVKLMKM